MEAVALEDSGRMSAASYFKTMVTQKQADAKKQEEDAAEVEKDLWIKPSDDCRCRKHWYEFWKETEETRRKREKQKLLEKIELEKNAGGNGAYETAMKSLKDELAAYNDV